MTKRIILGSILLLTVVASPAIANSTNSMMSTPPPLAGFAAKAGGTILDVPIPANILAIPLTGADGKIFTLGSLKGKTVVMTDFLTTCNDICPMTSVNMREIGDAFKMAHLSSTYMGLEVSVDPKRDTAPRMKAYQALYADSSWTVASPSQAGLNNFWGWFGVSTMQQPSDKGVVDWQTGKPVTYDVAHADVALIIGPNSHYRWLDLGSPQITLRKVSSVPNKLYTFLSAGGKANLVKPEEPSWTTGAVYGALHEIFKVKVGA
jgi:protein SCO1/2